MLDPHDARSPEGANRSGEIIPAHSKDLVTVVPTGGEFVSYDAGPPPGSLAQSLLAGLLRRKWLILGVFSVISAATIPFIWMTVKPEYRSTAVIQVFPVAQVQGVFKDADGVLPFYQSYLNTQVGVIRSPKVLERVLDRQEVRDTYWFREEGRTLTGGMVRAENRLSEDLSVVQRPQTFFIDVSMRTDRPEDAKPIVDAVVLEYLRYHGETRSGEVLRTLESLKQQRDQLNAQIDSKVQTMHRITRQQGAMDINQLRSMMATRRSEMDLKEKELIRQIKALDDRIQLVTGGKETATQPAGATQPADLEKWLQYAQDPDWRRLNLAVEDARHELEVSKYELGKGHPRIRAQEARIKHAEAQRKEREDQLDELARHAPRLANPLAMNDPENLKQARQLAEKELAYWKEDHAELDKKLNEASNVALEVDRLQNDVKHDRDLYDEYTRRIDELEADNKAQAKVSIATYGLPPGEPDRDRRFMFTAMALAGAMAVALSIGYLRTTTDRKIHDIGEVGAAVQAPFLGHLPRFRSENLLKDVGGAVTAEGGPAAIQVAQRAQQTLMESIRMIRTALLERVNETGEKVLLITSAQSASGKSSVALLLARTLSLVGKRVLLVEGDLRKPTLGERLSIESSLGLAAMLCGKATEEQAKEGSRHLPFDVIAAGEIPEEFDVELLSNGAFSGCIQRWRQAYDFVLVDSPPVLPVADARILAGHADGAIMVVRAGHDRRPDAVEAFSLLTASGGRLLGTVFIGGKPEQGYGRTYGYDYGYRYGCRRENQQQTEADVAASA